MNRRDALFGILGLGAAACTPPSQGAVPLTPQTGPRRVGSVPMMTVSGAGGTIVPRPAPHVTRPPSARDWKARLARNRQIQIERLRAYARRRVFPIYRGPNRAPRVLHRELTDREPVFVDDRGTHCAVGYLMDRAGWSDVVADIAASNNHVYIEEVDDGPLIRWIETSGLTQQEASFVQPSYGSRPLRPRKPPPPTDDEAELPPPPPTGYASDVAELVRHFRRVDEQLREDSEMSLDEAYDRLRRRLDAVRPVGRTS